MTRSDFEALTPDLILDSIETALKTRLTGLTSALPSYINRVYALQTSSGDELVAKFYRPGRWSFEALQEEHAFVLDCAEAEIPVIAPMRLADGTTLGRTAGDICFAVYPKRWGRELEVQEDIVWRRLGMVIGRLHVVGSQKEAPHRVVLHPAKSTEADICELLQCPLMLDDLAHAFEDVCNEILDLIEPLFDNTEAIRLHGDCHRANVLNRMGEGLMLIDFDDMVTGPPVQDLWLMLPGHANETERELDLMLEGYTQFRKFERSTVQLIEPLRAMRQIYFLAWCGRQSADFTFRHHFPEWGSRAFWTREISDLRSQLNRIRTHLQG